MEAKIGFIGSQEGVVTPNEDLLIWMCRYCGMRYAKDTIPPFARGYEQKVFYASIAICPTCNPDKISVRGGIKKRVDLPTSIGSIQQDGTIKEDVYVNS